MVSNAVRSAWCWKYTMGEISLTNTWRHREVRVKRDASDNVATVVLNDGALRWPRQEYRTT
jgi:hypothetical protein